ncbi:RNA methyltransferase [Methanobacterium formicicum]|uniref:RNA methyltransferase n=1 Tax=Methanobacterium formicicum TaxID=2162 RepID=UPI0024121F87|nr:RNA methyltransferase [Methanobacterium formicicum]MDG3547788.1 RNA methyltransferase [Methanobacterium formicicum]
MIYVVFVEPETPGNIGFLARTMKNFGLRDMVLINPCQLENDSYYKAMHAREIVSNRQEYSSLEEFIKINKIDFAVGTTGTAGGSYNIPRIAVTPENLAQNLNERGNIALIFGREGDGLTNQELELCDVVVSIPTHDVYPILNITHAAAIIFYELFKTEKDYPVEEIDETSVEEKQDLIRDMNEVLDHLDYPDHKKKNASTVFRRVMGRAFISGREAHTLKGVFRRIKERI